MMLVGLDSRSNNAGRSRNAVRGGAALAAGILFAAGAALPAVAANPPQDRVLIPPEQVSIQMFSLIPWVSEVGLEPVLERLSEMGFENIEPFDSTFSGYSAEEFRELTDGLGISVPSSHYNVDEDDFDETLDFVAATEIG